MIDGQVRLPMYQIAQVVKFNLQITRDAVGLYILSHIVGSETFLQPSAFSPHPRLAEHEAGAPMLQILTLGTPHLGYSTRDSAL